MRLDSERGCPHPRVSESEIYAPKNLNQYKILFALIVQLISPTFVRNARDYTKYPKRA